ncbi:HD domain-containing protein [Mollicutes bacterium LVI A0078]|nr:HD domain-containing protein [Mollicutes bacterium LVI A0075]WOO90715.1 HD domain-containing protein [Mollicutes bacterium LVI A0078]
MNFELVKEHVKTKLAGNTNGHGYDHAYRVVNNVKLIAKEVECDYDICVISAYVHDLIDRKVVDDIDSEIIELEEFLRTGLGLEQVKVEHILKICNTISYSKNLELESVEAMVVQDADRLDALGATGIARTIEYSVSVNRPIYIADDKSDDTAIGHFHSKLYKLPALMNFEISKEIAKTKLEVMYLFEENMIRENRE